MPIVDDVDHIAKRMREIEAERQFIKKIQRLDESCYRCLDLGWIKLGGKWIICHRCNNPDFKLKPG